MVEQRNMRAAVYGRESKSKTKSIADQVRLGEAAVAEQGWTHAGSYDDGTSASRYARKQRKDWERLLADIEAGQLDVIVVWETTRADRNLTTWVTLLERCRDRGVRVHVVSDERTYDPRRARDYRDLATAGVDAAYETDRLGERVRRGKAAAAAEGKPAGGIPYGFLRRYDPDTRDPIDEEHPDEGPVVREIVGRLAAGEPTKVVTDDLNARKVPTRYGGPWLLSTVARIARNPVYIGRRRHNGGVVDAMWPGYGDEFEQQWHAAQRVFAARKGQGWRSARITHLLTGIPVCTKCGKTYAGRVPYRPTDNRRYGCRNGCGYVDADELEELVLAYALGRLARRDVWSKLRRAGEGGDKEAAAARAEADRLRERLDEARQSAASPDGITYAALAVQERELGRQIEAAEKRADRAGIPPAVRKLAEAGDALPEVWADMPMAARRDVIRYLVEVTVRPARGGRHARPLRERMPVADRVTIEWKGTA